METPLSTITQTGDLGGQKVKMAIDENALAHIMSILTDLYSDPVMAVIREYSTNALDSHIEAGNTDPIEVFTPTGLSPFFRVIDHGVGLSVDDIVDMYSKYGASTKRDTNEQVGMLGLGAKSALTLVPQFSLTSVKNGVKIFVSVSRSADGSGQMEIVDTKATDEPNGVEISVPITKSLDFFDKARNFFKFWEPGTVLLNGLTPSTISGRKVGDKFIIDDSLASDYVVMGNVAYPVKDGIYASGYWRARGIVARVAIGAVNFTPSREELQYTRKTKETIDALRLEFNQALTASAQADIDAAQSHADAWAAAYHWNKTFNLSGLTYKGTKVPSTHLNIVRGKAYYLSEFRSARSSHTLNSVTPDILSNLLFVTGFAESLKPSPTQRAKARKWCEQQGISVPERIVLFTDDSILPVGSEDNAKYLANALVAKWEEIAKIKIDRASRASTRRTDPYDRLDGSGSLTQVSHIDTNKPIVYYSPAEHKRPIWLFDVLDSGAQVFCITKNRWEKFKRDFPTAQHYYDAAMAQQKKLVDALTDDDKILWHLSSLTYRLPTRLDYSALSDKELSRALKVLRGPTAPSAAMVALQKQSRDIPRPVIPAPVDPLTKYPLGGSLTRVDSKHALWYLNSFYNEFLKEN